MSTNKANSTESNAEGDDRAAEHLCGAHLLALTGRPYSTRLREMFRENVADLIVTWHRENLGHGHAPIDPSTGNETDNPYVADLLAFPVAASTVITEALTIDLGLTIPTREQCRQWVEADRADGGDGTDPEEELDWARLTVDPDVYAAATTAAGKVEPRINGVPKSVFDALPTDEDRDKVRAGLVIAAPHAPTFVAQWLLRHRYTRREHVPGKKRPHRAWARLLLRIDQTWFIHRRLADGEPQRWVARTDPELMRARLRAHLKGLWYVKTRQLRNGNEYSLKSWNPDDRSLTQVENALADLVNAGASGTAARELLDVYGWRHHVYPETGTWVLCRNGVVDVTTGRRLANTPLWFSPAMIEADYDAAADPREAVSWLRVLGDQMADDPGGIACLQEWFGYVISGRTDLQKWMLIIGPSGSGKSIIAAVLRALVGASVATTLDKLNGRFGLAAAYRTGATLAVLGDIRFSARDSTTAVETLLTVIGEDAVTVEAKYKDEVTARLPVRFHGSANEMPRFTDNAAALQKRALMLETTRCFRGTDAEDTGLLKRILDDELGLVLRWAVEGLARLDANGGAFTLSSRAAELADDLAELSSPVRTFVRECCETGDPTPGTGVCVDEGVLFRVWGKWAAENKTGQRMSKAAFRRALKALSEGDIKASQRNTGQRVVWGIARAATDYADRDRFGVELTRTIDTDDPGSYDPMSRDA
jgi:putative DNA primase/helicase